MHFNALSTMHSIKDKDLSIPDIDAHAPRKKDITKQLSNLEKRVSIPKHTWLRRQGDKNKRIRGTNRQKV